MSFSSNMMNGVARLINAYGDSLKDNLFVKKLGRYSVKEISRTAKERRAGSLGYAEALLIFYNKKSHSPLRWDTLYAKKPPVKKRNATEEETSPVTAPTASETDNASEMQDGQLNLFTDEE